MFFKKRNIDDEIRSLEESLTTDGFEWDVVKIARKLEKLQKLKKRKEKINGTKK